MRIDTVVKKEEIEKAMKAFLDEQFGKSRPPVQTGSSPTRWRFRGVTFMIDEVILESPATDRGQD